MTGNAKTLNQPLGRRAATAAALAGVALLALGAGNASGNNNPFIAKTRAGALIIEGDRGDGLLALRLRAGDPDRLELDFGDDGSADRTFKRDRFDRIEILAGAGADRIRIDEANGVFTDTEQTSMDGEAGDDTLLGGSGPETFAGSGGDDRVDGNGGADRALLGFGSDTFVWDPGDGSDVVEGGPGGDALVFNGSGSSENFDASANGNRLRFLRDLGNIVMDVDDVEQVDVAAGGGADRLVSNDLAATDVRRLNGDLGAADGAEDRAIVNATDGNDEIEARGSGGRARVTGLVPTLRIENAESGRDVLAINALAGIDRIDGSGLAASAPSLVVQGGPDVDLMIGGDGDDVIDGDGANDTALMGAGDDTFIWDPGDGSDIVEGQGGADTMAFNGSAGSEVFDVSPNGNRVRFFRNLGNITMDVDDVERIDVNALGGSDRLNVEDVSGTDLTAVEGDLAGTLGGTGGDGAADEVVVHGTAGDDAVSVTGANGSARALGLAAAVEITNAEAASDTLRIVAEAGDDVVDASALAATAIKLVAEGNEGDDVLIGGAGDDTLLGQEGDDVLVGGPGLDVLDGGTGSNVLIQD